jgi:hypothetical protein
MVARISEFFNRKKLFLNLYQWLHKTQSSSTIPSYRLHMDKKYTDGCTEFKGDYVYNSTSCGSLPYNSNTHLSLLILSLACPV